MDRTREPGRIPDERPEEAVRRAASLARLEIDDALAAELARDVEDVLGAFATLGEMELEGTSGMARLAAAAGRARADEPEPSLAPDEILRAAPRREGDFYSVPRTVGGDG